jgi:hypothetical protein
VTGQPATEASPGFREAVSPDGLLVRAAHRRNPYRYLMNAEQFDELLLSLGLRRAESILRNHTVAKDWAPRGVYERASMGFVMMDPTVGPYVPDADAVLAVITVGHDGAAFLPNAAAKAAGHRRLGRNYGEAVLVDPHLCGDGNFRFGHSAEIRGQIVGSSSQTTDQDLHEASALAADFVGAVTERHLAWQERVGPGEWLADDDSPGEMFRAMIGWFPTA